MSDGGTAIDAISVAFASGQHPGPQFLVESFDAPAISATLSEFWRERARTAPTAAELRQHVESEARYMKRSLERRYT